MQEKDPTTLSHEQGTRSAKIVQIVWLEITNLFAQAQNFQIFEKKLSLDVRSPWVEEFMVEIFMVEKIGVEKFKVEKSGIEAGG